MNKITLALALGTGLALGLAAPSAQADPIVQQLATPTITAAQFNSLFTADGSPTTSSFQFDGAPPSGMIESQAFTGTGAAAGLTAYAYQLGVNNVTDSDGNPVQVNSASFHFNSTPVNSASLGLVPNSTGPVYAYTINDGQVGGLNLPQAAPGEQVQDPTSLAWQPGSKTGALTVQYLDAKSGTGSLDAGANSATFVVITDNPNPPVTNYANIQSPDPQIGGLTSVLAPTGGSISPVPAPEPTTILAWAGVLGGIALVRRVRKNRAAIA